MDLRLFDDARLAAKEAGAYFATDPFSGNVIAFHLDRVIGGLHPPGPDDLWATVVDGDRVVGVAMHTPPRNLFLARCRHLPRRRWPGSSQIRVESCRV
jgi:hypothetical protein